MGHAAREIGLIDVVEWQSVFDLCSGEALPTGDTLRRHELVALAAEVCRNHPYPGDLSDAASRWVTDTALDVVRRYSPRLLFVNYADLFFPAVFRPTTDGELASHREAVVREVERLVDATGFAPVIVGTGGLAPFGEYIDVSGLDGLAVAGGMTVRHAGVYAPSERDLDWLDRHPGIERVVRREEWRADLGGRDRFYERCAPYIAEAGEGFIFRGVNTGARPLYRVPRLDKEVPLHTSLGSADSLTDIADLVLGEVERRTVVLVIVEAFGCDTFPWSYSGISNQHEWYSYTLGDGQYLAITTGHHFAEVAYPPGYRYELYDDEAKPYPYSGIFDEMPSEAMGCRTPLRSAAVGNRSAFTHVCSGADLTIEPFVRALYNHGVMGVVRI